MTEFKEEEIAELVRAAKLTSRTSSEYMVIEDKQNLAASTGTNNLKFDQVQPGWELIVTHLSGYNETSAPTRIRVGYWNSHGYSWLVTQPAPLTTETVGFFGEVRLGEGMYPIIRFEGCTSGDDLYANLNGYWLKTKKALHIINSGD